jgi:glutathione S-transferase
MHFTDFIRQVLKAAISGIVPAMFEKDEVAKKDKMQKVAKEGFPNFLKDMEKSLKDNGGKWLVGKDLTYADLHLASVIHRVTSKFGDQWKKGFPVLGAYIDKVYDQPNIKKWLEIKPKTDM